MCSVFQLFSPCYFANFDRPSFLDEFVNERLSSSIAYVNIFVTDQNDNAPIFSPDSYKHTLTDIYSNTLLWLDASDPDEGVNAEFDFGLHGVTRVS